MIANDLGDLVDLVDLVDSDDLVDLDDLAVTRRAEPPFTMTATNTIGIPKENQSQVITGKSAGNAKEHQCSHDMTGRPHVTCQSHDLACRHVTCQSRDLACRHMTCHPPLENTTIEVDAETTTSSIAATSLVTNTTSKIT